MTYDAVESSHETFLYLAARMTGSALAGIEFEDLVPSDDRYAVAIEQFRHASPNHRDPPDVLAAYDGRNAHYAFAHPTSTLDTVAAQGLLNSLLRARGSPLRLISVLTNGAVVVAGPEAGLREALRRKLLIGDPGPESAELIQREYEELEKDLGL
jgi:hypothetical protein